MIIALSPGPGVLVLFWSRVNRVRPLSMFDYSAGHTITIIMIQGVKITVKSLLSLL